MIDIESGINEYFEVNFADLDLSKKEIKSRSFDGCTFEACNFSEAIFRKCAFTDCRFIKCNLGNMKIDYSKFNDVAFEECKVIGVDWTKGYWSVLALGSPFQFKRCAIDYSSFYGMSLKNILIEDCRAHDVDFREGDFSNSNFSHTDLSNSLFANTNLTAANFYGAANYDIDVKHNLIKNAKFSRVEALRLLESLEIDLID